MDSNVIVQVVATLLPLLSSGVLLAVKKLAPQTPKGWIPWLSPVIGALIDLTTRASGTPTLFPPPWGTLVAGVLGVTAVGLRELYDQWRKGNLNPTTAQPVGGSGKLLVPPAP